MLLRILLASPDDLRAQRIAALMAGDDVLIQTVGQDEQLWKQLHRGACDLVVLDDALLGGRRAVLSDIRALPDVPEVVVLSTNDEPSYRASLLAAGALAVVSPTVSTGEPVNRLSDFASSSPAMRVFLALARRVVDTDTTLLVLGETGVGKECLSRAIHSESKRSKGPFVAVNCMALSPSLLESELFGHVQGAFTGASRPHRGYFELAHRGTLLLDEIGELSPQLQVKLLRVLDEKKIRPVGAEKEIAVDVRIICATNRSLSEEVRAQRFRSDLYYRLSVVTLEVPALRMRREDIPGLAESNAEHFQVVLRRQPGGVRADAMQLLSHYAWPGNVRELINVMERAVLLCDGPEITPRELPPEIREAIPLARLATPPGKSDFGAPDDSLARPFREARREAIEDFERRYFENLLQRCHGRIKDATRLAGIHTRSFYDKLRQLEINKDHFKLPKV